MAWIEKRQRQKGPVYRVYWRDPSKRVRTKTFPRRRDAELFARKTEVAKDVGAYVDPALGKITVGEFFDYFISTCMTRRESTLARYETHGRLYIKPAIGSLPLNVVTRAHVRTVLADLQEGGRGAATIQSVRQVLHGMFELALEEDRIGRNPAHGIAVSPADRRQPRFLTAEEVRAVAEETPARYRTLIYFLGYTGLRIAEASALRVRNLDLSKGLVRVVESSPEVAGRKVPGDTKNRRVRVVNIGPQLTRMLKEHLAEFGRPLDKASLVFIGAQGAAIRQNAFRKRIFQPAAKRVGIQPLPTVHDLRHTAASLMASAGYSMRDAQEMLGHSHSTMTDRYTHLFPDERAAKVSALDRLIGDSRL